MDDWWFILTNSGLFHYCPPCGGDTTAKKTSTIEPSRLVNSHYGYIGNDGVLCEGGSTHLWIHISTGPNVHVSFIRSEVTREGRLRTKWWIDCPLHVKREVPSGMTPFPCVARTRRNKYSQHSLIGSIFWLFDRPHVTHSYLYHRDWSYRFCRTCIHGTLLV